MDRTVTTKVGKVLTKWHNMKTNKNNILIFVALLSVFASNIAQAAVSQPNAKRPQPGVAYTAKAETVYVQAEKTAQPQNDPFKSYDFILKAFSFVLTGFTFVIILGGLLLYKDRREMRDEFERDKNKIIGELKGSFVLELQNMLKTCEDTLRLSSNKASEQIFSQVNDILKSKVQVETVAGDFVKFVESSKAAITEKTATPANEATDDEKNAVKANNLGLDLFKVGKIDEAIAKWTEAIRLKSDYAEAYNNLGTALGEQKKHDEATEEFRNAIKIKPNYAEAHYNLGFALSNQGNYESAIKEYREAISIKPKFIQAYNNIGLVLALQGNLDEAQKAYKKALEITPDFMKALVNLAFCLDKQGERNEANQYWAKALQLEKDPELIERIKKRLAEKD